MLIKESNKNKNIDDIKKNHITLKKYYLESLKKKKLKKIFRPGNRECPDEKCYFPGQEVYIKILDIQGSDVYNIEPIHLNYKFPVKIISSKCKKISEFNPEDFNETGPDLKNLESLKSHLALIYNLDYNVINSDDFEVTVTEFEYL